MSFIYREKRGDSIYVYEMESYREGKKVKHRKQYLGIEKETPEGKIFIPSHKDVLDRIILTDNIHFGNVIVLHEIAKELEIAQIIDKFSIKGGGLSAGVQIEVLAINHAIKPVSLNRFASWYEDTALPKITGIPPKKLNKDNLSSAMDGICREIKNNNGEVIRTVDETLNICKELVKKWARLYDINLDALYYDITSTYFEGAKCILAKLGYSRDKKKGKVQINIALVITKEWGFPIGFMVYKGNTSDQKTVSDVLQLIRKEFGIKKCTVIWDRGMVCKKNIRKVDRVHQKIITGLKGSEAAVKKILLSIPNEDLLKPEHLVRELGNGHGIFAMEMVTKLYGKRRKIVVYLNTEIQEVKRKKRDFKLRSARIKLGKYRAKLGRGNYQEIGPVTNHYKNCVKGVSKFFKPIYHTDEKITIDWIEKKEKVAEANSLDGKFALMSTDLKLGYREIIDFYFEKDAIEKAFRCIKQVIRIHPTRCWLENRVRVHVFICYLSYLILRVLEYKLRKSGMKITAEMALDEVGKLKQGALIDPTSKSSVIKLARPSKIQKMIFDHLGLSGYISSES